MTMTAGEQVKQEAHKAQQAAKQASRLHRIERLQAKAIEDPGGIWTELLAEAREGTA